MKLPSWNEILKDIKSKPSIYDNTRRKYLDRLHKYTKRNIIIYYSGWLEGKTQSISISDSDMQGFMTAIKGLDKSKGLDLILHTPGGEVVATESIVKYIRSIFGTNYRVIVPHLAMSAGTMIACSAKKIIMGKHSSIGPIDPQVAGLPAQGIIEEFEFIFQEIQDNPLKINIWRPTLEKYPPTLYGTCQKAIELAEKLVKDWLITNMLSGIEKSEELAEVIINKLGNHKEMKTHSRHISAEDARELGLKIQNLEDDQKLQDLVLSIHHIATLVMQHTSVSKIIENHKGVAFMIQERK